MSNTMISAAITAAVMLYVNAGESFTALNISREVQNGVGQNPPVKARNDYLKKYVHAMYDGGELGLNYVRTLISVPDGHQAYLYHLDTTDPNSYDPTRLKPHPLMSSVPLVAPTAVTQVLGAIGNPIAPLIPVTPIAPVVPAVPTADKPLTTRRSMADGRLRIPVKAVQTAGLTAGDRAHLALDQGDAEIFATKPTNRQTKIITVDTYSNILYKVGVENAGQEYEIYVTAGYIKAIRA